MGQIYNSSQGIAVTSFIRTFRNVEVGHIESSCRCFQHESRASEATISYASLEMFNGVDIHFWHLCGRCLHILYWKTSSVLDRSVIWVYIFWPCFQIVLKFSGTGIRMLLIIEHLIFEYSWVLTRGESTTIILWCHLMQWQPSLAGMTVTLIYR